MTGAVWLLWLGLVATDGPTPPAVADPPTSVGVRCIGCDDAVVVTTDGRSMVVRSYRVDGRVVRIVDAEGTPLLLKTDLLDAEKSAVATTAHRQDRAAAAAAQQADLAAAAARSQEQAARNAAHRANSGGGGGNMWVAPESAVAERLPVPAAVAEGRPDVAYERRRVLIGRYNELAARHNQLVDQFETPNAARPQILAEAASLRQQMSELRVEIEELAAK